MRKLAKLTSILFTFVFLGMQFVPTATRPKNSAPNGAHMAELINPQVGAILDRSCQDCHSSRTTWPWYSRVAPVSWVVFKHVSEGREMLDFSEWANQPHSADERMLICDAVSDGRMPLPGYTVMHRNAKLSKRDIELICRWAAAPSARTTSLQVSKSTNQKDGVYVPPRRLLQPVRQPNENRKGNDLDCQSHLRFVRGCKRIFDNQMTIHNSPSQSN